MQAATKEAPKTMATAEATATMSMREEYVAKDALSEVLVRSEVAKLETKAALASIDKEKEALRSERARMESERAKGQDELAQQLSALRSEKSAAEARHTAKAEEFAKERESMLQEAAEVAAVAATRGHMKLQVVPEGEEGEKEDDKEGGGGGGGGEGVGNPLRENGLRACVESAKKDAQLKAQKLFQERQEERRHQEGSSAVKKNAFTMATTHQATEASTAKENANTKEGRAGAEYNHMEEAAGGGGGNSSNSMAQTLRNDDDDDTIMTFFNGDVAYFNPSQLVVAKTSNTPNTGVVVARQAVLQRSRPNGVAPQAVFRRSRSSEVAQHAVFQRSRSMEVAQQAVFQRIAQQAVLQRSRSSEVAQAVFHRSRSMEIVPEVDAEQEDMKLKRHKCCGSLTERDWRIPYGPLHWIVFLTIVAIAVADRFAWNVWPRETYKIGAGTAGSDFVDGIKPGPWSVALYDIVARVSGRYSILALNDLFFTTMNTSFLFIKETWIARHVIDFSDSEASNRRIHRINGIGIAVFTLVHVYSIFAPVIFHGYSAEVNVGDFEWPLSERGHADFSDVDPVTKRVMLQADDVWRLVEMTLLLCLILPLSVIWLSSKWHLGTWVHNFVSFAYFVDIVRRHTHPHSWIVNIPMFILWLLDNIIGIFWRRHKTTNVQVTNISSNYIVAFWSCSGPMPIAPRFFIRKKDSGCLERAHVFTCFGNRGINGFGVTEKPWQVGCLIRVYHNDRRPILSLKDTISHTARVAEDISDVVAWGGFQSDKSEKIALSFLHHDTDCAVVAGGSGGAIFIDALQVFCAAKNRGARCCRLVCLFSTNDRGLFTWMGEQVDTIINANTFADVNGESKDDGHTEARKDDKLLTVKLAFTDLSSAAADRSFLLNETGVPGYSMQLGRLTFDEIIDHSKVFFVGSGSLLSALQKKAPAKKLHVASGVSYDGAGPKVKDVTGGPDEQSS